MDEFLLYEKGIEAAEKARDEWIKDHKQELLDMQALIQEYIDEVSHPFNSITGLDFLSEADSIDIGPLEDTANWIDKQFKEKENGSRI